MNEDSRIQINLAKLFPDAFRRLEILRRLRQSWHLVVGYELARKSSPYNLGINHIDVVANGDKAISMLRGMKGNIQRALSSYGYESKGDFTLTVTARLPEIRKISRRKEAAKFSGSVSDEEVEARMSGAPESLPEDINRAISHLKVFLDTKFGGKK